MNAMSDDYQRELLDNSWQRSCAPLFIDGGEELKDYIIWEYSNPKRYYHNISHLIGCLQTFKQFINLPAFPEIVEVSIWFHDVIWNNEEDSYKVFLDNIDTHKEIDNLKILQIKDCIMATTHVMPTRLLSYEDMFMCDIDLITLGADATIFHNYCSKIRKEYSEYSDEIYFSERLKILHNFIDRGYIYRIPQIKSLYEEIAINNIKKEITRITEIYQMLMK